MAALKFKLIGGLGNQTGRNGSEYCAQSLNWYAHQGALKKRRGMTPIRSVQALETTAGTFYGAAPLNQFPGAVTAFGALPISMSGNGTILVGADAPFNRVRIDGAPGTDSYLASNIAAAFQGTAGLAYGCTFFCNSGSGFVLPVYPAVNFKGSYSTANDIANIGPWLVFGGSASGAAIATVSTQIEFVFEPPAGWAVQTIGGQSKFWIAIVLPRNATAGSTITNAGVCTTENRIMNVLTFQDRNETPHEFVVSMFGDDGRQLRFMMDGVVLSQSVDLQPDGNSRVFGPDQQIFSAYHGASDRVLGYIEEYGWFYVIPGVNTAFNLPADSIGTDTEFVSVKGGLRSFLPESDFIMVADTRAFSFRGQTISWSAPGADVDIWPNASQIFLDDGFGPITGAAFVNGSIIVFKRRAIYAMQLNGNDTSDTEYDAVPLSTNVGCIGGLCPAGDSLFFVGEDGIYRFNGRVAVQMTDKFDEEFFTGKIGVDFSKTKAMFYSPTSQVRFFFPFESSNILDRAMYINAAGIVIPDSVGSKVDDSGDTFSAWPQGRMSQTSGEYGFQATAVCADFSLPVPRNLVGDRFGFLWELDSGFADGGFPVVASLQQSEQNYAGTGQALVGPVYVSQSGRVTQEPLVVGIIPNNQFEETKQINAQPYERGMFRGVSSYPNPQATCRLSQAGVTKRINAQVRCHSFGVYVYDASIGIREINGFSVDVIPVGNRGF